LTKNALHYNGLDIFGQAQVSDEFKQTVAEQLNQKTMFMNPRTGTVQSLDLWRVENNSEHPEPFIESELIEVKLVNEKWVRVN
jgi:hypothetical protein